MVTTLVSGYHLIAHGNKDIITTHKSILEYRNKMDSVDLLSCSKATMFGEIRPKYVSHYQWGSSRRMIL